jgi:hypothetical protein
MHGLTPLPISPARIRLVSPTRVGRCGPLSSPAWLALAGVEPISHRLRVRRREHQDDQARQPWNGGGNLAAWGADCSWVVSVSWLPVPA